MANKFKSGGREKGTPNKVTTIQREFIQALLDKQTVKIETELSSLSGKEYLSVILSLMEFTTPKLNRTTELHHFNKGCDEIIIRGKKFAQPEKTTIVIE